MAKNVFIPIQTAGNKPAPALSTNRRRGRGRFIQAKNGALLRAVFVYFLHGVNKNAAFLFRE